MTGAVRSTPPGVPGGMDAEQLMRLIWVGVVGVFGALGVVSAFVGTSTHVVVAIVSLVAAGYCGWAVWRWPRPNTGVLPRLVMGAGALAWSARLEVSEGPNVGFALLAPTALGVTVWGMRPVWTVAFLAVPLAAPTIALVSGRYRLDALWRDHGEPTVLILAVELLVFLTVATSWAWYRRWDAERERERDLALARERLRFASDLHDVQGHTLLAIKFKTELARRSLDRDVEFSRAELAAVERLVTELETQTRQIAQNSRETSLAVELGNLRALLGAAGIDTWVDAPAEALDLWDDAFAVVVREAASNILRHADAARVEVVVSEEHIGISNDGALPRSPRPGSGSGLEGLRERLAPLGALVSWSRTGSMFTLRVRRTPTGAIPGAT